MLIGPSKNVANNGKGMYVGLKQPLGDGERCVTPARAAAKETTPRMQDLWDNQCQNADETKSDWLLKFTGSLRVRSF